MGSLHHHHHHHHVTFTPCTAYGIHEELPSVAISSYPIDLIPLSFCISYFVLCCPSPRSLQPISFSIPLRNPIQCSFLYCFCFLRNACPIQFHFLLFIWVSIDFCLVILHSFSFLILSVHFTFIIFLKHLLISVCNLLVIWLVVFQVSQAYNSTDFTFVLNSLRRFNDKYLGYNAR
jgi:hypothetical protein